MRGDSIDDDGQQGGKLERVDDATRVDVAIESVLVGRARVVCDLNSTGVSRRVVVDVEVRSFVETMQYRTYCGRRKVVVDVCESRTKSLQVLTFSRWRMNSHCDEPLFTWVWRHFGASSLHNTNVAGDNVPKAKQRYTSITNYNHPLHRFEVVTC